MYHLYFHDIIGMGNNNLVSAGIPRCKDLIGMQYEIHTGTLIWESDWCEIHTLILWSNWCKQHATRYADVEFFFLQKEDNLKAISLDRVGTIF